MQLQERETSCPRYFTKVAESRCETTMERRGESSLNKVEG